MRLFYCHAQNACLRSSNWAPYIKRLDNHSTTYKMQRNVHPIPNDSLCRLNNGKKKKSTTPFVMSPLLDRKAERDNLVAIHSTSSLSFCSTFQRISFRFCRNCNRGRFRLRRLHFEIGRRNSNNPSSNNNNRRRLKTPTMRMTTSSRRRTRR